MTTQTDRIRDRLDAGLMCSWEPFKWEPPVIRVAARIQDLKDAGHSISTVPCKHGDGTRHVAYLLDKASQRSLFT